MVLGLWDLDISGGYKMLSSVFLVVWVVLVQVDDFDKEIQVDKVVVEERERVARVKRLEVVEKQWISLSKDTKDKMSYRVWRFERVVPDYKLNRVLFLLPHMDSSWWSGKSLNGDQVRSLSHNLMALELVNKGGDVVVVCSRLDRWGQRGRDLRDALVVRGVVVVERGDQLPEEIRVYVQKVLEFEYGKLPKLVSKPVVRDQKDLVDQEQLRRQRMQAAAERRVRADDRQRRYYSQPDIVGGAQREAVWRSRQ
jgi:hypothetical protein